MTLNPGTIINGCLNTESPPNITMLVIMMSNVKIVEHYCCWYGGGVSTWCVVCCWARGPPTQKWFRFSCLLLFSELEIKGMLGNNKMSNDNLHFNEYLPNNYFKSINWISPYLRGANPLKTNKILINLLLHGRKELWRGQSSSVTH